MLDAGVVKVLRGLEGVVGSEGYPGEDRDSESVLSVSLPRLLEGRRSWTCCTASSCRRSVHNTGAQNQLQ